VAKKIATTQTALRSLNINQWDNALKFWSLYPPLLPSPEIYTEPEEIFNLGLETELARVHLRSRKVFLNGLRLQKMGLIPHLPVILAHEAGHLLFSPASLLIQFKSIEILQTVLPEHTSLLPKLVNLWQDLLINHLLKNSNQWDMIPLIRALAPAQPSLFWVWILRSYEYLWRLKTGTLVSSVNDSCLEADAIELANLIKDTRRNDLSGIAQFGKLCNNYLIFEQHALQLLEGTAWGPVELVQGNTLQKNVSQTEDNPAPNPSPNPLPIPRENEHSNAHDSVQNFYDSPQKWQKFWAALSLSVSAQESSCYFYKQKAQNLLAPWKIPMPTSSSEQTPEGLSPWLLDAPLQEIAWVESLFKSPRIVPGLTTVRQYWSPENETKPLLIKRLDIYLDTSGSLPHPHLNNSKLVLTGVVLALSALHQGWSVRVTLWSGATEQAQTQPFSRNETQILLALTHYLGGSTRFPVELLAERYKAKAEETTHIALLSDQGILESLGSETALNLFNKSLKNSLGGGSLCLQLPTQTPLHPILSQLKTQGWHFQGIYSEADVRMATQRLFQGAVHA
jgi:hypothetical protein